MWSDLRQDLGYAVRTLFKNGWFAATAVLTLGLGIGANTAIFSVINGVLLRPQPYRDADRLAFLWSTSPSSPREPLTPGRLVDFRDQLTTVSGIAGISQLSFNLTDDGEPERIAGSSVSSSFFDVLGTPPLLGDVFHSGSADDQGVVLSHGLWMRRFGGDRGIIGRRLVLNGLSRTVIAVMPAAFDWPVITATPSRLAGPELWVPGTVDDIPRTPVDQPNLAANRTAGYLRAVVRLRDGVTPEQVRQEAQAIAGRLGQLYPAEDGGRGATLVPLRTQFVGHLRQPMLILFGAVACVLAIACANIASLLLGRGAARRRELAVRAALGASRARVIRQLLTESIVLASAGAAVGTFFAWWSLRGLMRISPGDLPGIGSVALDGRVLVFTVLLSILTGVLCGLAPALHASVGNINADLGETSGRGSEGRRSGRTRDGLVAMEIAVALVLLVGAGLLLRSFHSLSRVDTGIRTERLLTFDMVLTGERARLPQARQAFFQSALNAIAALPGVERAGAAATLPIGGDDFASGVVIEGRPEPRPGELPRAGLQVVTPGYFEAMGIRVVEGRDVAESDTATAVPVVLVNETFARQHWPAEAPVGRRIRFGGDTGTWFTVIGVVSDIRHLGPAAPPRPEFYQPYTQRSFPFMAFVVRTSGSPAALVPSIRAAITTLDRAQPISGVSTMEEHIGRALSRPRFMSTLITCFGLLALVLSMVGVYGVMAFSVAQRTREIAIRTALGATGRDVLTLVIGKALLLAAAGVAAGVATSVALSGVLRGLLYGVSAADPGTYAAVVGILGTVAVLAAAVPAWRAVRVAAAEVLR
jgi:putative ABC transport system permease protein